VDQKHIQENAAGQAERAGVSALGEIAGKLQDNFLEKILGAAGEIGAHDGPGGWLREESPSSR